jgi:hypothetical protein
MDSIKLTQKGLGEIKHSINNPLTIINAKLCKENISEEDKENMKEAVKRIVHYLNSLEIYIEG